MMFYIKQGAEEAKQGVTAGSELQRCVILLLGGGDSRLELSIEV